MTDEPEPTDITNRSGGADLNAQGDIKVGGDVVGRDKITTSGYIINAETVIINESSIPGSVERKRQQEIETEHLAQEKAQQEQAVRKTAERERRARQRAKAVAALTQRWKALFTPGWVVGGLIFVGLLVGLYVIVNANSQSHLLTGTNALTTVCQTNLSCSFSGDEPCPDTIKFPAPSLTSRIYISMTQRGEGNGWGYSLWEVEAFNGANKISLQDGIPRASSSQELTINGCNGAVCAIDNNPKTRWGSNWEPANALPLAWFEISLPSPMSIDHITLEWQKAYAQKYCVTIE